MGDGRADILFMPKIALQWGGCVLLQVLSEKEAAK